MISSASGQTKSKPDSPTIGKATTACGYRNPLYSLENKSMSCMIHHVVEGQVYKLRYKFIRAADGWDAVIRVQPKEVGREAKKFIELGYEQSQVDQLELSVSRSIGLIIITGPTGSGKTTTIKTMMEFDPKRKFKKDIPLKTRLN